MPTDIKRDLPKIVQEAGEINLHGTLIDDGWYQHLRFDSGVPNMIAILILSEVFYWYRPTVIKDEESGKIIEIKKKYHADKLQKDYKSLGERFGVSKRTAQNACHFLRDLGLITIEKRIVDLPNGNRLGNVTFIEPVMKNIRKISCMCKEFIDNTPTTFESSSPTASKSNSPSTPKSSTLHRLTNTKNTINTEGINKQHANPKDSISPSISQSNDVEENDGITEGLEKIYDVVNDDYLKNRDIPSDFLKSIEGVITHMYFSETLEIDGAEIPQMIIRKTLGQLTVFCIEYAYMQFNEYTRLSEVRRPKKYLQSIIYNSVHDENISMTARVNYKVLGNGRKEGLRNVAAQR